MPELPEVETVRRTLALDILGHRITRVRVRERRLRHRIPADFARCLTGRAVGRIVRRGKYLLLHLDDGAVWTVHLGMSGCLATAAPGAGRHTHVTVAFANGTTLRYSDPRRFGMMTVAARPDPGVARLGVDPLSPPFSVAYLSAHARRRRRPIKNLLMDQAIVAGLGNIYASEILFRAGVRPSRQSRRLRRCEVAAIHGATRTVLRQAIARGGSSIADYRDGRGRSGTFQLRLRVYGRDGEPCRRCGTIIRCQVLAGRSSFYCPQCQH